MNHLKRFSFLIVSLFCCLLATAQTNEVEMADTMRSSGRIYVVIAVILTILFGIVLYLVRLDRKITRFEKENHN
jgi:bacteriorhodopsin